MVSHEKNEEFGLQRPVEHNKKHLALKCVRATQYIWSTLALVFVACAIDRNILIPGVSADEKALAASSSVAVLVVLFHLLTKPKKLVIVVVDAIVTAFLFSTFVYGAYNAGSNHGACKGPKKIGVWDNTRGCTRMTAAAAFSGVNFAAFAVSTIVAFLL